MAISRDQALQELQRRGVQVPQAASAGVSRDAAMAELRRRGVSIPLSDEQALSNREQRPAAASSELGASRQPGLLDYVPGVGVVQDIPDILSGGFNSPEIKARRERREKAAKTLVPYAASAAGGALGAGVKGAGMVGRAIYAGLGSGGGDAAGQAVTQGGQVDPKQAAVAAAMGTVGQPIGEAVGAAVPAAARYLFRGGEKGRQFAQEAIADAARFGQTPTVAQATGRSFIDGVEGILAKTPGSAGRIRKQVESTTQGIRQSIEKIAQQGHTRTLDNETAGQAIMGGVDDYIGRFKGRAAKNYDRVRNLVGNDTPAPMTSTMRALDDMTKIDPAAPSLSGRLVDPEFQAIKESAIADLSASGTVPYETLANLRTSIGDKVAGTALLGDKSAAQWKKLYGALSDDIRDAASASGPQAERAYGLANQYYAKTAQHVEKTLQPLVRSGIPEKVFQSVVTGSKTGPTTIKNIYKTLNPEQQDLVTGALVRRLGTARPGQQGAEGAEFSFETFLTGWNQIDDAAKKAVFNRGRYAGLGQDINALARYAEKVRTSSRAFANPSGTSGATLGATMALASGGSLATAPFLGGGVLTLPLILGAGSGVANLGARLITSPKFVHWLAQSTKIKPNGIGAHIGRLGALAAKEDQDTREAIFDYMTLLQSPIGGAEAQELPPQQVPAAPQQPIAPQQAQFPMPAPVAPQRAPTGPMPPQQQLLNEQRQAVQRFGR